MGMYTKYVQIFTKKKERMPQIWQASNTMPIFGQHKRRKSEKKKTAKKSPKR